MCRLFLITIAVLAILFGGSGLYMMPKLIQQKIEQRVQLKIGTQTFDRFTRVPLPLTMKFYFFNITNSDQVLADHEQPKFQEVGPFMFKQWRRREVVDILDSNRKITYKEFKTYYDMYPVVMRNVSSFVWHNTETGKWLSEWPSDYLSIGADKERPHSIKNQHEAHWVKMLNPYAHNITMVNVPLLSVLTQLAHIEDGTIKRSLAAKIVSRLIGQGKEKILLTRAANQYLFDGYKVGLMDAASDLIGNTLGYNFESPLPRNKFGFFHSKNGTWSRREAGEMTVFTGRNNSMDQFMQVDSWNGLKTLAVWPRDTEAGNRCNEIRGTDGSQHHPGVTRHQTLHIFSPLICTSIYLKYKEDSLVRGIPLLRFTMPPEVFGAPKKQAQNACYCTVRNEHHHDLNNHHHHHHQQQSYSGERRAQQQHATESATSGAHPSPALSNNNKQNGKAKITNSRCYIDGLMDLSLCQRNAPIAASAPHFYNADPMLALSAGLEPRKELHETYVDVEPMTGAVLSAASRAQMNAFVEQAALEVVEPALIGHMTSMIAPLLWFEEAAQIDEKFSGDFKNQLLSLVQRAQRSFAYSIVFGLVLAACVALQYWYATCYKIGPVSRRQADLVSDDEQETPKQRRARRRKEHELRQSAAGGRKLTGARRANLAGRAPLIRSSDKASGSGGGGSSAVVAAVGLAAVLGAADAAATGNQRRERRRPAAGARATNRADYAQTAEGDDETLSRRALVTNEWPSPGKSALASASGGTTASSSPASTVDAGRAELDSNSHSDSDSDSNSNGNLGQARAEQSHD